MTAPASRHREASWRPALVDLAELDSERAIPPFVSAETFEWMRAEKRHLVTMTGSAAFDAPALAPVHGDLHLGNVLAEPDGRWWIVDWDDLHRGDPAADLSILLSPLLARGDPVEHLLGHRDKAFTERFALCARAVLLDDVIDSLADWARADDAPVAADEIRAAKRATHELSLRVYRERWG